MYTPSLVRKPPRQPKKVSTQSLQKDPGMLRRKTRPIASFCADNLACFPAHLRELSSNDMCKCDTSKCIHIVVDPLKTSKLVQIVKEQCRNVRRSDTVQQNALLTANTSHVSIQSWWSQTGSNRRPPACKAGALPAELWPLRKLVGLGRFELPTSPLSGVRSNQLSYRPLLVFPAHRRVGCSSAYRLALTKKSCAMAGHRCH